jgi:hypothetical protein
MAGLPPAANENEPYVISSAARDPLRHGPDNRYPAIQMKHSGFPAALILGMTWFGHFLNNKTD